MSVIYDSSNHFPIDVRPRRQRCPRHLDSSQFPLSLSINYIKRSGYKSIGVALLESNILPIRPTFNLLFSRGNKKERCVSTRERGREEGGGKKRKERRRREKRKRGAGRRGTRTTLFVSAEKPIPSISIGGSARPREMVNNFQR